MTDEPAIPPADQEVRSPRVAVIGIALVVITLLTAAVFVGVAIARLADDDDAPSLDRLPLDTMRVDWVG